MMPLGIIETGSWTAGMAAVDAMEKAAAVRVIQAELNDLMGVVIKIGGEDVTAVQAAVDAAVALARGLHSRVEASVIAAPADTAQVSWLARPEFNPLIEQDVVHNLEHEQEQTMTQAADRGGDAIGFIETQGFTAVIEAIDTACKAASVEVVGREKLGGGYISVVVRGDVAAVRAAVDAGRDRIQQLGLGKLIATHIIPRPSQSVLALLPRT